MVLRVAEKEGSTGEDVSIHAPQGSLCDCGDVTNTSVIGGAVTTTYNVQFKILQSHF